MAITYGPKVITNGLVFCVDAANSRSYPGSGSSWNDIMGTGQIGTLTNGTTFSNGAMVFDGSNDYVTFGSSFTSLDLISKSFQCWIKKTSNGSYGVIDKDFDNGGANYGGWGLWIQSNNKLWWWNHANLDLLDDGSLTVSNNTWTNVAVAYNNSSKSASFYINGVLNSTKTNALIVEKASTGQNLLIGATRAGGSNFPGSISIVQAYNRVLTANEISQNFLALRGRYGV